MLTLSSLHMKIEGTVEEENAGEAVNGLLDKHLANLGDFLNKFDTNGLYY